MAWRGSSALALACAYPLSPSAPREQRDFAAGLRSGKTVRTSRVMVAVGARDADDDPVPARALAGRLDLLSGYGLNSRFVRYQDEIHLTVPARAVADTLRFVFR